MTGGTNMGTDTIGIIANLTGWPRGHVVNNMEADYITLHAGRNNDHEYAWFTDGEDQWVIDITEEVYCDISNFKRECLPEDAHSTHGDELLAFITAYFAKASSHYKKGGKRETIDTIRGMLTEEEFRGYLKGNIIKYIDRSDYKQERLEDLKKGIDYLTRLAVAGPTKV